MKYFLLFLFLPAFLMVACSKTTTIFAPKFQDDPIYKDMVKKHDEFVSEAVEIQKTVDDAKERIKDTGFTPKLVDLIKNEIFVQEKFVRMIHQRAGFIKLQINDRKLFYVNNADTITKESIEKEYSDFLIAEKAKIEKYPWRLRPGLVLPEELKKPADKKAHGESPAPAPKH